jgi:peptidoglycan/LPS O-acetylase OafA/YrhL
MPGLDGVRAVAVAAVLLFHANPPWLPGGFLGVDVFFVLSGFLITSLLLTELEARGGLRLGRFYQHRAKRLLPALVVVLVASSLLAITVAQDAAARVREDVVASALYVTNWWYVAHGTSYFDTTGRPPLLQHLWSLAVEEQFYLLWPLLVYALWRIGGALAVRTSAIVGVFALTALMAWIAIRDGIPIVADSGRVYFGTDTHAMTLLAGAVLATYWTPTETIPALTSRQRRMASATGLASLVGLVAVFRYADQMSWGLYRGGFLWVALFAAGLIAAAAVNGTAFARALATPPLLWVGRRSYGIYLWHWPIFVVLRPGVDLDASGWPVQLARVALTLLAAELSYRYVEMPVRDGAVGRLWADWSRRTALARPSRIGLVIAATAGVLLVLDAGLTMVREPTFQDALGGQTSVGAGRLTAAAAPAAAPKTATRPPPAPIPKDGTRPTPARPKATPTPSPSQAKNRARATATARPASTGRVSSASPTTAVGDSVMLAAANALDAEFPRITVDADVSRMPKRIFDRIRERKRVGRLGDVVVIGAGTNGRIRSADLTALLTLLKDRRRVVLVTCHGDRSWISQSNTVIRRAAKRFGSGNVRLADWDAYAAGHRRSLYRDGIHPRPGAGAKAYAGLVRAAVRQ